MLEAARAAELERLQALRDACQRRAAALQLDRANPARSKTDLFPPLLVTVKRKVYTLRARISRRFLREYSGEYRAT